MRVFDSGNCISCIYLLYAQKRVRNGNAHKIKLLQIFWMIVRCISFLFLSPSLNNNLRNSNEEMHSNAMKFRSKTWTIPNCKITATICLKLRLTVIESILLSLLADGAEIFLFTFFFSTQIQILVFAALDDGTCFSRHWNLNIPIRHVHFPFVSSCSLWFHFTLKQ